VTSTIVAKNVGYELRCADPIPHDMEYARDLGYCAAKWLLDGGNAVMVTMQAGEFVPVPFAKMLDPQTGRAKIRFVDLASMRYAIARRYMIRIRRDDFDDERTLAMLAATAKLPVERFREEFQGLVEDEPPAHALMAKTERAPAR
jgi:6-phosphofructokinase 1